MAKDNILLRDVAARGATMLELRCGRCDGQARLSVARLLGEYGAAATMGDVMRTQIGDCPRRGDTQSQNRGDPHWPDLAQLFGLPETS